MPPAVTRRPSVCSTVCEVQQLQAQQRTQAVGCRFLVCILPLTTAGTRACNADAPCCCWHSCRVTEFSCRDGSRAPLSGCVQVPAAADAGLRALPGAAAVVADLRPGRRAHSGGHSAAAAAEGARSGNSMTMHLLVTTQGIPGAMQHGRREASSILRRHSVSVCRRRQLSGQ
jgi:hypothetical protein